MNNKRLGALALLSVMTTTALANDSADAIRPPLHLKPGLWTVNTTTNVARGLQKAQVCLDRATEAQMIQFSGGAIVGTLCGDRKIRNEGSTVSVDSTCSFAGYQIASHVRLNFSSETAFDAASVADIEPPLNGNGHTTSRSSARWRSACPASMQPGDLIAPNGRRANVNDLLGMAQNLLLPSWGRLFPGN